MKCMPVWLHTPSKFVSPCKFYYLSMHQNQAVCHIAHETLSSVGFYFLSKNLKTMSFYLLHAGQSICFLHSWNYALSLQSSCTSVLKSLNFLKPKSRHVTPYLRFSSASPLPNGWTFSFSACPKDASHCGSNLLFSIFYTLFTPVLQNHLSVFGKKKSMLCHSQPHTWFLPWVSVCHSRFNSEVIFSPMTSCTLWLFFSFYLFSWHRITSLLVSIFYFILFLFHRRLYILVLFFIFIYFEFFIWQVEL